MNDPRIAPSGYCCDNGNFDDDHVCQKQNAARQPDIFDLIAELRREVGLFDGAMPITPQQAWEEALDRVRALREAVINGAIDSYMRERRART